MRPFLSVLVILFSILVAAPAWAAPVILYTDIISGPNTGGENNNGAYLSIFGTGFGADINAVTVTIGGGEVANYIYLGASLGMILIPGLKALHST